MERKLFFITHNLSGGGAERVISNLANHFSGIGYKITLICLDKDEMKYSIAPEVIIKSLVKRSFKPNIFTRCYYALITFIKLMYIIKKEQPFYCISFMTSVNLWTGMCCLLLNKNYIVSERTSPYYSLEKLNTLTKWIAFKIYNNAKFVVLPSQKMINTYKSLKQFNKLENIVPIYNPIHVFNKAVNRIVYPKPFILSVGRLDYNKGFDFLIEAFHQLKTKDIHLLISGTGPNKKLLEDKVTQLGLDSRVRFVGFMNNLQDYYTNAKLFVLASRVEGYPNVLVEAMSLGCPVVATDCDFGPSEIIQDGVNGFLVKLDDREELVNAMEKILTDQELSLKFSTNGKLINETNSIKNIAEKWNNLILS